MSNLYGIDLNKKITSQLVVQALVKCFYKAHCESEEFENTDSKISENYCLSIVKKAFKETGGNFDNPDKKSLTKVISYLKKFSENFRSPEIVIKHFNQINKLIEKIDEN